MAPKSKSSHSWCDSIPDRTTGNGYNGTRQHLGTYHNTSAVDLGLGMSDLFATIFPAARALGFETLTANRPKLAMSSSLVQARQRCSQSIE